MTLARETVTALSRCKWGLQMTPRSHQLVWSDWCSWWWNWASCSPQIYLDGLLSGRTSGLSKYLLKYLSVLLAFDWKPTIKKSLLEIRFYVINAKSLQVRSVNFLPWYDDVARPVLGISSPSQLHLACCNRLLCHGLIHAAWQDNCLNINQIIF